MVILPIDVVRKIRSLSVGKTDEILGQQFGISYNTWRKIDRGEPIRDSLAQRIMARVQTYSACPESV